MKDNYLENPNIDKNEEETLKEGFLGFEYKTKMDNSPPGTERQISHLLGNYLEAVKGINYLINSENFEKTLESIGGIREVINDFYSFKIDIQENIAKYTSINGLDQNSFIDDWKKNIGWEDDDIEEYVESWIKEQRNNLK